MSEKEKRVCALVVERKIELIEYLQKLIRFRTVTPLSGEEGRSEDFVLFQSLMEQELKGMGFELDVWEVDAAKLGNFDGSGVHPQRDLSGMPVLAGKLEGAGKGRSLLFNGHYDVVPAGRIDNWRHDPFAGEIENGRIYGRGACDMKGGIAAMVKAIQAIQATGIELQGELIVETVPDEEATSMGTLSCCERGYRAQAAIIPEPTNMNVLIAMRGNTSGTITVPGRAGHADMNQPHWREGGAVNAISKAARIIDALDELSEEWRTRPDKRHKFLDPDIVLPTIIRGGEWSFTYPEKVDIEFTADFIPGTLSTREEIVERVLRVAGTDSWLKEHPPTVESDWIYGAEIGEDEPIVRAVQEAAAEFGVSSRPIGWGCLSDAVHLINFSKTPTVSVGLEDERIHMPDEFISIDRLLTLTKVLAVATMRWCGSS